MAENINKITRDIVDEFKNTYVKETGLGVESDEHFKKLLENAYAYIIQNSADFDIHKEPVGKQLVFDRAWYVRERASGLFYESYMADMSGFGMKLAMERGEYDTQDTEE